MRNIYAVIAVFVLSLGFLSGCGSPSQSLEDKQANYEAFAEKAIPCSQLYLHSQPYSHIHIEFGAVNGSELDDDMMAAVAKYVKQYTGKTVTFSQSVPLPYWRSRGVSPRLLAIRSMQGPPSVLDPERTAYMHVFCRPGINITKKIGAVYGNYAAAAFILQSGVRIAGDDILLAFLKHEVGHCLSLCIRDTSSDFLHCTKQQCIMRAAITTSQWLDGEIPTDICDECRKELSLRAKGQPPANLRFDGPFLVRQEDTYSVVKLPSYRVLDMRTGSGFDWKQELELAKARMENFKDIKGTVIFTSPAIDTQEAYSQYAQVIEAALKDPDSTIVYIARKLKDQFEQTDAAQAQKK